MDLENEMQKMWHLKVKVVLVIVGDLVMIKKRNQKHRDKIPGEQCLKEVQ